MAQGHRRLIWQLYGSQLLVALAALVVVAGMAATLVRGFYLQQAEADLAARGRLIQGKVGELLAQSGGGSSVALREYCRQAGGASATRITVIALDGLVLADSERPAAELENHRGRPEVEAALIGRQGRDIRFSSSTLSDTMYVALPLSGEREGEVAGVLRTAIPLLAVSEALGEIYRRIAWSALLIAILVALVAGLGSRRLSRPLEEMRAGAERFAAGRFTPKIKEEGAEELAALAGAMNRMAGQLALRLQTIACQHNQLQAVVGSMVEGVITVDGEQRVLDLNRAAAELLNVKPEQARGKSMQVAIRNSGLQQLARTALAAAGPIEGEFTLLDDRGRERFCHAHGVRLALAAGGGKAVAVAGETAAKPLVCSQDGIGAVLVISDLTRLRRLENLRRDFVANVSHELKTPITSITGFAETLLEGALAEPEEARRFVGIILQQSRRLHAIVEDLLTLSRIEQEDRRQEVPLQELPLMETIQAALQLCWDKAAERGMALEISGPENLRARINPALLEQALVNLIDNAIKYSPEGRPITLSARNEQGEILIAVRDQGQGIPAAALPRLFERFYRVDKARSSRLGGTGLGLAIVKHIVQAHRGRVEVVSEPGRGSTFTIHLPAPSGNPGP